MTRQTKPNAHQLNLGLLTEGPMDLPKQQRMELAAALADMLLQGGDSTGKGAWIHGGRR